MARALLTELLLFLIPFKLYGVWFLLRLWRLPAGERAGFFSGSQHPWHWLVMAGLACVLLGFLVVGVLGHAPAGSAYTPPHLENGQIVPGQFRPK